MFLRPLAHNIIDTSPGLTHLMTDVVLVSFCPEGFVGIGVTIVPDVFVRNFVFKTCRDIIDDVEKLDAIQDGFIHYQLLRFCQTTLLQHINSNMMLSNRCVLYHHHVDCKITDTLLKRGTKHHVDGWDTSDKTWSHMVLHLPDIEGGFGVTFNAVTKDTVFYTTTSRFVTFFQERQRLWMPKDDVRYSSSRSSPASTLS